VKQTHKLTSPTITDVLKAGKWRDHARVGLRTPGFTTDDQQRAFHESLQGNHTMRYWSVRTVPTGKFVAFAGLSPIQWQNRLAEISLVTDPKETRKGHGMAAVDCVLDEAFGAMGLATVCGEVYHCNPAKDFWAKVVMRYEGHAVDLPRRKMWDGELHPSTWFTLTVDGWRTHR
jgi:RimJ/RimL family protein N-acetyltransferase